MLFLASQSPRRAELLTRLGLSFTTLNLAIPELRRPGEPAFDYVSRVSRDKALAGWAQVADTPGAVVLGADTEVVLDGEVFGKPADASAAMAMLRRLSGRDHQVVSVVTLVAGGEAGRVRESQAVSVSDVRFAPMDETDIDAYVASGEPMGKAGAYAIQGAGERFVAHLSGSHSGVMGLPLHDTSRLLREFGVQ